MNELWFGRDDCLRTTVQVVNELNRCDSIEAWFDKLFSLEVGYYAQNRQNLIVDSNSRTLRSCR